MTDEFATYDGAYVLGALSDDERRRFEDHVLVCDSCAESVRSLRGLPALLATVPPTVLEKEPEDPPANLLPVAARPGSAIPAPAKAGHHGGCWGGGRVSRAGSGPGLAVEPDRHVTAHSQPGHGR